MAVILFCVVCVVVLFFFFGVMVMRNLVRIPLGGVDGTKSRSALNSPKNAFVFVLFLRLIALSHGFCCAA